MTDQEINEAVARKLGWNCVCNCHPGPSYSCECFMYRCEISKPKDYCHSIAAAWEIPNIESLIRLRDGRWSARFGDGASDGSYYEVGIYSDYDYGEMAIADTAPMAICLAFLKLDTQNR